MPKPKRNYLMTSTAESHFWKALHDTRKKWGQKQAEEYRIKFLDGLQNIADNYQNYNSAHRKNLALGTDFSLHLVEHRYVVFQEIGQNNIIIVGIFHESMDIPRHLRELQESAKLEVKEVKQKIILT